MIAAGALPFFFAAQAAKSQPLDPFPVVNTNTLLTRLSPSSL
jgi:hypothetical protein